MRKDKTKLQNCSENVRLKKRENYKTTAISFFLFTEETCAPHVRNLRSEQVKGLCRVWRN